jgi:hypothetical protein
VLQDLVVTADNLADLETAADAALAPLLTHYIRGVKFPLTEQARLLGGEFALVITYETGAPAAATPFQLKISDGKTWASTLAARTTFIAANPGWWYSEPLTSPAAVMRRNRSRPSTLLACSSSTTIA